MSSVIQLTEKVQFDYVRLPKQSNNNFGSVSFDWLRQGFSIQILVNSKSFKLLSLSLSLTYLWAQIACYELKGDFSPVILKEIFHESFENLEITRICMANHASVTGWQELFFSYKCFQLSAAVVSTFEMYGWKCSGYLILICSFRLC